MDNEASISLRELNSRISEAVTSSLTYPLWVRAEVSECRTAGVGHCYMNLVEKSLRGDSIVAQQRATCWNNRWVMLRAKFEQETGQHFDVGLKVLMKVQVNCHEVYGLSLNVLDIDPSYTMGDIARRRMEIIRQLQANGLMDMQQQLPFPTLPQRIAVISAENAAGYGDFCQQLANNEWGVKFYWHLFPAAMQGQQTETSVMDALDYIYKVQELFDVVVIIRGGGAVTDLASFDSYPLAEYIANFPLPVITGIGHDRDQTIIDMVAHIAVKTPTAAAALLIDAMGQQMARLEDLQQQVIDLTQGRIEKLKVRLEQLSHAIQTTHLRLNQQQSRLLLIGERIRMTINQRMERERQRQELMRRTVEMAQPDKILRRGFSISRVNGHTIKNLDEIPAGTVIETQTAQGIFVSIVASDDGLSPLQ